MQTVLTYLWLVSTTIALIFLLLSRTLIFCSFRLVTKYYLVFVSRQRFMFKKLEYWVSGLMVLLGFSEMDRSGRRRVQTDGDTTTGLIMVVDHNLWLLLSTTGLILVLYDISRPASSSGVLHAPLPKSRFHLITSICRSDGALCVAARVVYLLPLSEVK